MNVVIRNIFSNWVGLFTRMVITFFLTPFIVHHLGDIGYGIWVLIGSITGYMGLLDLGVGASIIRYVSKYASLNERENLHRIVSTAFVIYSCLAVFVLIVTILIATRPEKVFNIPDEYLQASKVAILIVGINMAASFPLSIFSAVLHGIQRYDITNAIGIFSLVLRTALIVCFLGNGYGIIALSLIALFGSLFHYLFCFYFSYKELGAVIVSLRSVNMVSLKLIFNYSVFILLSLLAGRLIFYTDSLVIGHFLSVDMITYFAIPANLVLYLRQIVTAMTSPVTSSASSFEAKKDLPNVQKLLVVWTKYALILTLPAGIVMATMGKPLISLWIGEKYGQISNQILIILAVPQVLGFPAYISGSILRGIEKHKFVGYAVTLEAISNLVLSIVLVKKYGLIGVALGTSIPLIIRQLLITPLYVCKQLKIELTDYVTKSYLFPVLSGGPSLVLCAILAKLYYPNTVPKLLFEILVGCLAYLTIAYFTCTQQAEKDILKRTVLGVLGSVPLLGCSSILGRSKLKPKGD